MNLWGNRVGQLTVLAVALFFLSCEEETSLLGYKNPTSKFNLTYTEIPVESSVLLMDSVRTSNFNVSNDLNRLLVGYYDDPVFGKTTATALAQFVPVGTLPNDTSLLYIYDSLSLFLRFDFYAYGSNGNSKQGFSVHRLNEILNLTNDIVVGSTVGGQQIPTSTNYFTQNLFYSKSTTGYEASPIGTQEYDVDLEDFDFNADDATPKTEYIKMPLDYYFGEELFDAALARDSTFTNPALFTKKFFGLALTPGSISDKIVGFYPTDDSSRIRLYYHTVKKSDNMVKDTAKLEFSFSRVSYNKITTDRSSSDLSTLTNFYEDFTSTDTRYVQAGTGVATKIDLNSFVDFSKSIPRLAINSAELVIKNVNEPGHFAPPKHLLVKILKDNNRLRKPGYPGRTSAFQKEIDNMNQYRGTVRYDQTTSSIYATTPFDSTLNIVNDTQTFFTLTYSEDDKEYRGTASLFFQELFRHSNIEGDPLYNKVVLIPYEGSGNSAGRPINGKTVNRISFHKDDIVLRVYYSTPTANN